ncbi:MAG: hypothetical protein ACJ735_11480 [Actinomycetes bacterium]
MTAGPTLLALKRCVLAVSVLDDVALLPRERHVVVAGDPVVRVPYRLVRRALAGAEPESPLARHRLAVLLRAARWAADLGRDGLRVRARPYGVAVDHPEHPGLDWVRDRVMGDTLDVGIGFVGLDPDRPDTVLPVPPGILELMKIDVELWWQDAAAYLDEMAAVASLRQRRQPTPVLRPMGDCDVVTLLGSRIFRVALVRGDPTGMRGVAVPMRARGWLDLAHIDPAFAAAAAAATEPAERGFDRPLLVTADELVQAPEGGRPAEIVLRDPAAATPVLRDVLYR